jgi:hypothetical protein
MLQPLYWAAISLLSALSDDTVAVGPKRSHSCIAENDRLPPPCDKPPSRMDTAASDVFSVSIDVVRLLRVVLQNASNQLRPPPYLKWRDWRINEHNTLRSRQSRLGETALMRLTDR